MKVKNLIDLKLALFDSISRLTEEGCDLDAEVKRATTLANVASTTVAICKLELDAAKFYSQYGYIPTSDMTQQLGLERLQIKQASDE